MKLEIQLQPKQLQFLHTVENIPVTFYGGAKGGGKSAALRRIQLIRRLKYPRSEGAIFRRSFPELEANHIRKLFQEFPGLQPYYKDSKKTLFLPNGSTLRFCYCENDKDVLMYQGQEIHDLSIDEAGQWTESMFKTLLGSNRSGSSGIRARCMLTGNPGGIGHGWLKRLFVERRFHERERPEDYAFIQALVADNPALMDNDPDYVHRLNSEPNEALRKAYLYGDWDIFAGQFFQEISRSVHFIKAFSIPPHWNRFGSYDFGFNHPAAFGWFANDEDGNTFLYREFIRSQFRVDQFAREILRHDDTRALYPIVAGLDCWTQKAVLRDDAQPPTVAEEFATHELHLKKAIVDRIQGANQLRKYLAWRDRPNNKPRFFIFDTCPISYDCLSRMIVDPDRPEDVLKVDATEGDPMTGDDAYDMIRMGLMSRPLITDAPSKVIPKFSNEWYQQQSENIWEKEREKLQAEQQGSDGWPSEGGWPSDE